MWELIFYGFSFGLIIFGINVISKNQVIQIRNQREIISLLSLQDEMCNLLRQIKDKG